MPIVTFYSHAKEQVGNTVSAITFATYLGITKNQKTLLISTAFKDKSIQESFWTPRERKISEHNSRSMLSVSGIEELDRAVRSNRAAPNIITNYTKVALRERLEILDSLDSNIDLYNQIQESFAKIIEIAKKYYDIVIVDLDKNVSEQYKKEILNISDVVLALTPQKVSMIMELKRKIESKDLFPPEKTIITLGRYDKNIKYNIKNISRNILKQRKFVNAIPYCSQIFEGVQEGKIIDVLWKLQNISYTDENYELIKELQRLEEVVLGIRM